VTNVVIEARRERGEAAVRQREPAEDVIGGDVFRAPVIERGAINR
jgi:hypothetical protein